MKISDIDRAKHMVSEMMNKENDEHARLLSDIKSRINNDNILDSLTLVHDTRIKLLEEIFQKLKEIK